MRAHGLVLGDKAKFNMDRMRIFTAGLQLWGVYTLEHVRDGEEIGFYVAKNDVTTLGLSHILDVQFHGTTQVATWYLGLIDSAGFTALADGDTLASHGGWSEFTNYTGNRQEWTEGAAVSGVMTNAATVDFAITGSGTIKGLFLSSVASGTSGVLWSTALFSGGSEATVVASDTLKLTYTINAIRS
jgi:hypothetical protein